ncbi:hypothetical protein PRK78_004797 [Emydomyces testavorans]|uniref:RING-type domain-containing protein n=1 Tax=Emydomyces testavorans TaxID=2070801 RepID=A0AAF0DIN6_9EURO|nr:hypothetical protein PRK78_004797 [Emydomyces testavorans]
MGQAGSSQRAEFLRRTTSASNHQELNGRPSSSSGPANVHVSHVPDELGNAVENPVPSTSNLLGPQVAPSTTASIEDSNHRRIVTPGGQEDLSMEGLTTQYSADTRQSAQSSTSRLSAMSRLGSRIFPNSMRRSLHNDRDEGLGEGWARRGSLFSRSSSRHDSRNRPQSPSFRNLGGRGITRRRSIRGPYALPRGESALLPDSPPNPTFLDTDRPSDHRRFSWRRHSRLSHMRNSIVSPMSHIFGHSPASTSSQASTTPRRPSRSGFTEDSDSVLPSLRNMDSAMDLDEPHELDSVEPTARHLRSSSSSSPRYIPALPEARRSAGTIRSRATRLLRRDEPPQTPLSHILHLAASALAAQISGSTPSRAPNVQSVGADGLDGPLESLLQGLQQIASSQEENSAADNPADGSLPNVNFLRVFRFVNPSNAQENPTQAMVSPQNQEDSEDHFERGNQGTGEDNPERRLLTLVVVGVRSIPANSSPDNESGTNARLNVESLLRLPFLSAGNLHERPPGGFLRRGDGRPRFSSNRSSIAGQPILTGQDSQRHQRSSASSRRQSDAGSLADLSSSLPTALSESPPGPNPPPSTPADPGLSGASSMVNTPSRRPSSASAFLPQLNEEASGGEAETATQRSSTFSFPRQRRRSDSEAARHRGLGSGAARRNGVVEPDDPSPNTTRSWLIYVVGANLAENHPALAAPSLFTDNPTYEDMMLLSSLLGPVKPPVASEEEVASAGGLYRLVRYPESLVAESPEEEERVPISENDSCLICLCNYEADEEVRLLAKCRHIYHRECIDEWLTTGRNSCPLCRGEGVSNSSSNGNAIGPEINAA